MADRHVSKTQSIGRTLAMTLYPNICTDFENHYWKSIEEQLLKVRMDFSCPFVVERSFAE